LQSFYFGQSVAPLYGVYHEPSGGEYRSEAVLICHPIGHEYLRTHRMVKLLADRLAALGYYVLRFDYSGTGDSFGDFQDFSPEQWCDDIELAKQELQSLSGCQSIHAIGIRFGAAMLAFQSQKTVFASMFLWDPIVDGADYKDQLEKMSVEMLGSSWWFAKPRPASILEPGEMVGYLYGETCLSWIEGYKLSDVKLDAVTPIHFIATDYSEAIVDMINEHENSSTTEYVKCFNDMGDWADIKKIDSSITTQETLNYICKELG